ncbi:MAG TPA: alpha/beta hydrolase [Thermohalobaculum sp.]|nr:alpha/beta hydrolase [Thermohalobaculum sp.]
MQGTDWDDAYDNRGHIPDAASYPPRWAAAAAAFRAEMEGAGRARLDIPYGTHPRERLDLFLPEGTAQGLAVFVHGGYWRTFARSDWSHLAAGALGRGWAVAVPGYTLCPAARIAEITRQVGAAIGVAGRQLGGPIRLAGHSAGGHLAARMVCEDAPLPASVASRIAGVLSISGVHDLRPLLRTAINRDLRLDRAEARAESPALLTPREDVPVTCWVGGDERPEFRRQSVLLANIWTGCGVETRSVEEPGRHHFDVIDGLADPDSPLLAALLGPRRR